MIFIWKKCMNNPISIYNIFDKISLILNIKTGKTNCNWTPYINIKIQVETNSYFESKICFDHFGYNYIWLLIDEFSYRNESKILSHHICRREGQKLENPDYCNLNACPEAKSFINQIDILDKVNNLTEISWEQFLVWELSKLKRNQFWFLCQNDEFKRLTWNTCYDGFK